MSVFEAILLGIIQGLSEFLPISSTGHVTVAGKLLNLISNEHPEQWTGFLGIVQLGTLASILIYFAKDIVHIVTTFLKENLIQQKKISRQSQYSRLGWLIIIGTIPVVIVGLAFEDFIEGIYTKNLYVIVGGLIGLAILLGVAEKVAKFKKDINEITIKDSVIIGIAQVLALIPGSSRSGTTITAGLFVGLKRDVAARFSFLLSIPAVLGSGVFQLIDSLEYLDSAMALNLIVATIFSAISGYLAIDFLLKFLKKHSTYLFVYYRIAIGLFILILLITNSIKP
ncbi:MAG: undecaprenyl-diphosphatase UppP [Ignavibacteriaceae bacterium]